MENVSLTAALSSMNVNMNVNSHSTFNSIAWPFLYIPSISIYINKCCLWVCAEYSPAPEIMFNISFGKRQIGMLPVWLSMFWRVRGVKKHFANDLSNTSTWIEKVYKAQWKTCAERMKQQQQQFPSENRRCHGHLLRVTHLWRQHINSDVDYQKMIQQTLQSTTENGKHRTYLRTSNRYFIDCYHANLIEWKCFRYAFEERKKPKAVFLSTSSSTSSVEVFFISPSLHYLIFVTFICRILNMNEPL